MKSEAVKVDIKHTLQIIRGDSASSDEFSSNSGALSSKKVNKVRHRKDISLLGGDDVWFGAFD
jgi:hypothetical protein